MIHQLLDVTTTASFSEVFSENVDQTVKKASVFLDKFKAALPDLIRAAVIIVIGLIIAKLAAKILKKILISNKVDASMHTFIINFIRIIIYIVFVVSALSSFGFNVSSFIAAIGAAGVTAGLGLQQSVSQFASGIQILLNHPFKSGDYIEVGSFAGNVVDIHIMYTVITTVDNKRVIIPNSSITAGSIVNYTAENKRRIDFMFGISYSSDISKAKNIIMELCDKSELALKDPQPIVYVNSHEASSVCLLARVWCMTSDYWELYYQMEEQVKLAFDREGIVIPFNQLEVKVINQ